MTGVEIAKLFLQEVRRFDEHVAAACNRAADKLDRYANRRERWAAEILLPERKDKS